MKKFLIGTGSTALVAGVLAVVAGMSGGGNTAYAGESQVPPCDSTSTPTITATATLEPPALAAISHGSDAQFVSFQQEIPTCTPTQTIPRTHTPTPTGTPEDTATPGPTDTPAPPPSPTVPTGEPGGGGVAPPDTGFGPDGDGGTNYWFVLAGATLLALGGGSLALGLRRR